MVARRAHNPKVVGSNPASATTKALTIPVVKAFFFRFISQSTNFVFILLITDFLQRPVINDLCKNCAKTCWPY